MTLAQWATRFHPGLKDPILAA